MSSCSFLVPCFHTTSYKVKTTPLPASKLTNPTQLPFCPLVIIEQPFQPLSVSWLSNGGRVLSLRIFNSSYLSPFSGSVPLPILHCLLAKNVLGSLETGCISPFCPYSSLPHFFYFPAPLRTLAFFLILCCSFFFFFFFFEKELHCDFSALSAPGSDLSFSCVLFSPFTNIRPRPPFVSVSFQSVRHLLSFLNIFAGGTPSSTFFDSLFV